jgi:hypothetical protein
MAAIALTSSLNLRYPKWQGEYQTALLEVDPQTLLARVAAAETAILVRLPAISRYAEGRRERQAIEDSLRFLRILKNTECLRCIMYISQVTERLAVLKRELDEVKQMNLRYWGQGEHTRSLRMSKVSTQRNQQ